MFKIPIGYQKTYILNHVNRITVSYLRNKNYEIVLLFVLPIICVTILIKLYLKRYVPISSIA